MRVVTFATGYSWPLLAAPDDSALALTKGGKGTELEQFQKGKRQRKKSEASAKPKLVAETSPALLLFSGKGGAAGRESGKGERGRDVCIQNNLRPFHVVWESADTRTTKEQRRMNTK